jgi:hypothetical protein
MILPIRHKWTWCERCVRLSVIFTPFIEIGGPDRGTLSSPRILASYPRLACQRPERE